MKKGNIPTGPTLKQGKVQYKYMPRSVHGVFNKNHILFDGKLDGSIDQFPVFMGTSGQYVLDLTPAEEKFIMEGLGLPAGSLNTHKRNNEYLNSISIEMPKFGLRLDTTDPWDMLQDKILTAYRNTISPNLEARKNKQSYRYVRISGDEETKMILEKSDSRKEAYKLLGSLEESRERMVMFLLNSDIRVHPSIKNNELRKTVNETVELSYGKFISTLNDPLFHEKGILNMALILGVVETRSGLYYFDSQPLCFADEIATLDNAAKYILDKTKIDIKVAISKVTIDKFNNM